jgi:hypothetical protein
MNESDLRQTLEMGQERDARLDSWMRYLVGMASAALTLLITQLKDIPTDPVQRGFLKLTWVSLGLGILAGSIVLFGRVFAQRELVKRWVKDRCDRSEIETYGATSWPTTGPNMILFRCAGRICYLALAIALISLVGFGLRKF